MNEIWKPISGYEEDYLISSLGNIYSKERECLTCYGSKRTVKGRMIKPFPNEDGYLAVNFTKNGRRQHLVHRLVLETFIGPCPPGGEGCHGDGIKTKNCLDNLRWAIHFENMTDRRIHKTIPIGDKVKTSKLNTSAVVTIKQELALNDTWGMVRCLSKKHGVDESTIGDIRAGRTWNHIPIQEVQNGIQS